MEDGGLTSGEIGSGEGEEAVERGGRDRRGG